MKKVRFIFILLILFSKIDSIGAVKNVPGSYSSIQSALDSCSQGDTVLVAPGIYYERITWPEVNSIKLLSTHGPDSTFITSDTNGRILIIYYTVIDTSTIIRGFTISNRLQNQGSNSGGGIAIYGSSVKLEYLNIENNYEIDPLRAFGAGIFLAGSNSIINHCNIRFNSIDSCSWCHGSGIYVRGGDLKIKNSKINNNNINGRSWSYGAGIYLENGNAQISNSEISNNYASSNSWCYGAGIYATRGDSLILNQTRIESNLTGNDASWKYGAGAYLHDIKCKFTNVLIANNTLGSGGGWSSGAGVYYDNRDSSISEFRHVTIANNGKLRNERADGRGINIDDGQINISNSIIYNPGYGREIIVEEHFEAKIIIENSNIRNGFVGLGNIDVNPQFISQTDFRLSNVSDCAGAGIQLPDVLIDLDNNSRPKPSNTLPDMGCYEINQSANSLSALKLSENPIILYPNPVKKGHTFKIKGTGIVNLKLMDINGRLIHIEPIYHSPDIVEIKSPHLSAGIYFVILDNKYSTKLSVLD